MMRVLLLAFLIALGTRHAWAQVYPVQPITIVVPFAEGGASDIVTRLLAERLSGTLGQKVRVENRPGRGGVLATEQVSQAAPDGYTLLYVTTSTLVLAPIYLRVPGYDPLRSLEPISLLSSIPAVVVVNPKLPARSLEELLALIKASPGKYRYAHSGPGGLSYNAGELFKSQTGLDVRPAQARGPIAAAQNVAEGHADMMFDLTVVFAKRAKEGEVRPLAIMANGRSPDFPGVPSVAEAGLPEFTAYNWSGLVAPYGTPPETVQVLNRAVQAALSEIETQATFQKYGLLAEGSTPQELHRIIGAELAKWSRALPLSATSPQ